MIMSNCEWTTGFAKEVSSVRRQPKISVFSGHLFRKGAPGSGLERKVLEPPSRSSSLARGMRKGASSGKLRFRNLCKEVKCWKHSTEYWQEPGI